MSLLCRGLCIRTQHPSTPASRLSGRTSARQPPGGARAAPLAAAGRVRWGCPGGHGTAAAPLQLLGAARLRCCVERGTASFRAARRRVQFAQEAIGGSKGPRRFCELEAASGNAERMCELVETAECYPLEPRLTQGECRENIGMKTLWYQLSLASLS